MLKFEVDYEKICGPLSLYAHERSVVLQKLIFLFFIEKKGAHNAEDNKMHDNVEIVVDHAMTSYMNTIETTMQLVLDQMRASIRSCGLEKGKANSTHTT